jgi:hypothetical protein
VVIPAFSCYGITSEPHALSVLSLVTGNTRVTKVRAVFISFTLMAMEIVERIV